MASQYGLNKYLLGTTISVYLYHNLTCSKPKLSMPASSTVSGLLVGWQLVSPARHRVTKVARAWEQRLYNVLNSTYYTALYCTALCCSALCCSALCCTALY